MLEDKLMVSSSMSHSDPADHDTGSKYAFDELLPRWLASMSPTLDDDIAQHTVIVTLGASAHELCQGMQQHYRHQCVLLPHWTGPDRMYHFADDWYTGELLCDGDDLGVHSQKSAAVRCSCTVCLTAIVGVQMFAAAWYMPCLEALE